MPHTLPSLTRLARPPTPPPPLQSPNLESGIDAAADVRVDFEVVGFESRNHRDQWLSPNGSEAFFGTSERFRTVPNGSEAFFGGSRATLARFRWRFVVRFVQYRFRWEFVVEGRGFNFLISDSP